MNISLLYPKARTILSQCFEKCLRKKHYVETFDLIKEQYYLHYFNIAMQRRFITLGKFNFNIPSVRATFKKRTTNIFSVMEKCERKPDLIIEINGGGYHRLEGYRDVDIPKFYWSINSHDGYKSKIIARDFDYIFIAQEDYAPIFKEVTDNIFWLPLAADLEIHKKYDFPKIFDIVFVGSRDPKLYSDRIKILNKLSEKYGLLAVDHVYGENMSKIYKMSKIGFNMSLNGDLNNRVFEVMSCGTMLLTDRIENGISNLFKDREHLVMYETEKQLNELIQY